MNNVAFFLRKKSRQSHGLLRNRAASFSRHALKPHMTTHIFLRGKEVVLRPPSETDIPLLTKWMNDPEIRPFMRRSFPVTEQNQRDWLESLSHKSTTEIVLIIVVKERPIGTISLKDINLIDRTAETSTVIGEPDCWIKAMPPMPRWRFWTTPSMF